MLMWLILGVLLAGSITFAVNYIITKQNIIKTVKDALNSAETEVTRKILAHTFKVMVKEKKDKIVKLEVLSMRGERLEVSVTGGDIDSSIHSGMMIE